MCVGYEIKVMKLQMFLFHVTFSPEAQLLRYQKRWVENAMKNFRFCSEAAFVVAFLTHPPGG